MVDSEHFEAESDGAGEESDGVWLGEGGVVWEVVILWRDGADRPYVEELEAICSPEEGLDAEGREIVAGYVQVCQACLAD